MTYRAQTGTCTNPLDLLNHIRIFAGNYGRIDYCTVGSPNTPPTGGGYIADLDILGSALDETWTLVCTTAGSSGPDVAAVFSVTGSSSGLQGAAATQDIAYTVANKITFKIKKYGLHWALNDKIVITSVASATRTASADSWVVQRNGLAVSDGRAAGADYGSYPNELILMGKDDGGAGGIFVGLKYESSTNHYFSLAGMDSFSAGLSFDGQIGCHKQMGGSNNPVTPLQNGILKYWMTVTPRRIICAVQVNVVSIEWIGLGLVTPYMTAGQYAYPLFVGGSSDESDTLYSSAGNVRGAFWNPSPSSTNGALLVRQTDGTWHRAANYSSPTAVISYGVQTYPYQNGRMEQLRENLGGTVPLIPICILDCPAPTSYTGSGWVLGEFDGLFATCGKVGSGNQTSGNTIGGTPPTHYILQSAHRNSIHNYSALKVS